MKTMVVFGCTHWALADIVRRGEFRKKCYEGCGKDQGLGVMVLEWTVCKIGTVAGNRTI